jgi:hypothetical protein
MGIPTEYIQIISAGIYAMALFFTIVTFWRTKRLIRSHYQITFSKNYEIWIYLRPTPF